MKHVFILEDDVQWRLKEIKKALHPHAITHVTNVTNALYVLKTVDDVKKFTAFFLDHDLQEDHYIPLTRTGQDIAKHLAKLGASIPDLEKPYVIVHSLNPYGGKVMADILTKAGFPVSHLPAFWTRPNEIQAINTTILESP